MNNFLKNSLKHPAAIPGEQEGSYFYLSIDAEGYLTERYCPTEDTNDTEASNVVVTTDLEGDASVAYLYDPAYFPEAKRVIYFVDGSRINEASKFDGEEFEEIREVEIEDLEDGYFEKTRLAAVYTGQDDKIHLFFQSASGYITEATRDADDSSSQIWASRVFFGDLRPDFASPLSVSAIEEEDGYYFLIRYVTEDGTVCEARVSDGGVEDITTINSDTPFFSVTSIVAAADESGVTGVVFVKTQEDEVYIIKQENGSWVTNLIGKFDPSGNYLPNGGQQAFMDLPKALLRGLMCGYSEYKREQRQKRLEREARERANAGRQGPCY